ncbi:MAG: hypothetical protein V2B19_01405 [Pseudomonadota bacterium]
MSPTLLAMLSYLSKIAKEKQSCPVVCSWCNGSSHIKYGTYHRYAFVSDELITIQRYYCKHDNCRRTFSILPHPFLRITRYSICLFQIILSLCEQELPIDRIAKMHKISWGAAMRAITKAKAILAWIREEAKAEPSWAPSPCRNPARHWSHFTRMFAAKFYPKRYGFSAPTEHVYIK